jgi:hypothetical protein
MATHRLAPTFSPSTADTQREQKGGTEDPDHRSAVMLPRAIYPERRCESRMDSRLLCSYEMIEAIEEESVVIEQGKAIALNRSTEGMLLCMRQAPHARQLIEVHTPRYRWSRAVTVFDVRWIRPVQVGSFGKLYLVGCQRVLGPCHYLSF